MPETKSRESIEVEICKILNKIGALKFGAFRLTSGELSPYYVDLRIVPSFPDAFRRICDLQADFVKEDVGLENFDRIAGIPVAGIPFASLIAFKLNKPFLYIRKDIKLHGRQRRVEGILSPGERVLLVDDLVTTGLSLVEAAKAVETEGGVAKDVVVLLDREEDGKRKLLENGIRLHSLVKMSETAARLHEIGSIDEEQFKVIMKQIKT